MRSYTVAIAFAMLLSAIFSYQNPGDVTVRFLVWTRQIPQGVWEVSVFAAGCVLMWIVSVSAHIEGRGRFRKVIREQADRIARLEEERADILKAIRTTPDVLDRTPFALKEHEESETSGIVEARESTETEEDSRPSPESQGD